MNLILTLAVCFDCAKVTMPLRETVSTATGTEPRVTETRYEDPLYRRTHVRKWLHGPSGDRWVEEKTEYDGACNVVKRIDALQRETVYGEDWAYGRVLTHRYDAMDRRDQTRDALGIVEERLYDFDGNVERLTDANGHITRNVYDALQRLTHQELPSIPSQPRHVFTVHTIHNEIIQQADPGQHVTSNTYDSLGRKIADRWQYRHAAHGI